LNRHLPEPVIMADTQPLPGVASTLLRTVEDMRAFTRRARASGRRLALVPTMGALHEGHLSLVRQALDRADDVIVSIFVNPTQFAVGEDLDAYPRTLAADIAAIASVTDTARPFVPSVATMYPPGFASTVELAGPAKVGLEDRFRPTHFAGVATVVAKLLNQAQADVALFGEKDFQQLKVVTRMAADLDIPTEIIGCATVREPDGLAMSSRNRYLSVEDRQRAARIPETLQAVASAIRRGVLPEKASAEGRLSLEDVGFHVDYLEARHAETLAPVGEDARVPMRLLVAAKTGMTRLIDNIAV
jgi:pantoate--beta-alanine ligase